MDIFPAGTADGPPPEHVAIIMDGNGRWAKARGLTRGAGHRQGAEAVKRAIEGALRHGVKYLTLYGFSSENWRRPESEVLDLMSLLRFYLANEIDFLREHGVRFRSIGDRPRLPADVGELIDRTERLTAGNSALTLVVALSYGSRAEIAMAARCLAERVARGELDATDIDELGIERHLYTRGLPDPDLIIRTSGEQRISNFLLWQSAYAELIFTETLWPDFGVEDFDKALREFHRRERRFGMVGC